jgi:hypothetical protein
VGFFEQSLRMNSLQNRRIRGDHGLSRKPRILDRTQEVAGSSLASSMLKRPANAGLLR